MVVFNTDKPSALFIQYLGYFHESVHHFRYIDMDNTFLWKQENCINKINILLITGQTIDKKNTVSRLHYQ